MITMRFVSYDDDSADINTQVEEDEGPVLKDQLLAGAAKCGG